MSFLAVLMALLIEQVRPLSQDNPVHALVRSWVRWLLRSLDAGQTQHGALVWLMAVVLPTLLSFLIYIALSSYSVLLTLLWTTLVLYLTLGFRQFSHHFTEIREALELGNTFAARSALARWQGVALEQVPQDNLLRRVIEHAVMAAHRHVLGVLVSFVVFWLLGLGPAGAVLYRLADYLALKCAQDSRHLPSQGVCKVARTAWRWINHVPARATALCFAAVGNFEEAVASWRQDADMFDNPSDGVVLAATAGALNVHLGGRVASAPLVPDAAPSDALPNANAQGREPHLAHLASLVGLVWRSVVLWMLLLALLTLARLAG